MEMFKSNDNLQLPQICVDLPGGPLAISKVFVAS